MEAQTLPCAREHDPGWESLANAIVVQAAKDYRMALNELRRHPDSKAALHVARRLERFFRSGWYSILTDVDPVYLIRRLRKEAAQ